MQFSSLIELDDAFVDYLNRNGIILPKGWDYVNDEASIEFENILTKVNKAFDHFNGTVFPKLNWSAPKDAYYMICNGSTMNCTHPSEVIYLLKASEFITHDLTVPYHFCTDLSEKATKSKMFLILKQWMDMNPAFEFRCFVRDNNLIAVSQRYANVFCSEVHRNLGEYLHRIKSFYLGNIHTKFALSSYVFDLYVSDQEVLLIDFNVFSSDVTDPALFRWDQLVGVLDPECVPLVACVENENQVRPSAVNQYAQPIEIGTVLNDQTCDLFQFLQKTLKDQEQSSNDEEEQEREEEPINV